jgi:uncharacterized protein YfaS (alpha-2-macroglobulin family)
VRKRKIEMGIEHLLGMQRYNGSFGLWSSDSEEEYWLTAYVTDFLLRAREQGYGVPAEVLKKASERLLRYLQERNLIEVDYSENADHTRFAVQAYAALVLARSQQAPLGALRSLFDAARCPLRPAAGATGGGAGQDGRQAAFRASLAGGPGHQPWPRLDGRLWQRPA